MLESLALISTIQEKISLHSASVSNDSCCTFSWAVVDLQLWCVGLFGRLVRTSPAISCNIELISDQKALHWLAHNYPQGKADEQKVIFLGGCTLFFIPQSKLVL